jgi:hypothetical protein
LLIDGNSKNPENCATGRRVLACVLNRGHLTSETEEMPHLFLRGMNSRIGISGAEG